MSRGRKKSNLAESLGRALSSTERSQLRRAKIKAEQGQSKALKNEAAQRAVLAEVIKEGNIPTAPGQRIGARKYHLDRPATAAERKAKWKENQQKQNKKLSAAECNNCGYVASETIYAGTTCSICKTGKYELKQQGKWKVDKGGKIEKSREYLDEQKKIKETYKGKGKEQTPKCKTCQLTKLYSRGDQERGICAYCHYYRSSKNKSNNDDPGDE